MFSQIMNSIMSKRDPASMSNMRWVLFEFFFQKSGIRGPAGSVCPFFKLELQKIRKKFYWVHNWTCPQLFSSNVTPGHGLFLSHTQRWFIRDLWTLWSTTCSVRCGQKFLNYLIWCRIFESRLEIISNFRFMYPTVCGISIPLRPDLGP